MKDRKNTKKMIAGILALTIVAGGATAIGVSQLNGVSLVASAAGTPIPDTNLTWDQNQNSSS